MFSSDDDGHDCAEEAGIGPPGVCPKCHPNWLNEARRDEPRRYRLERDRTFEPAPQPQTTPATHARADRGCVIIQGASGYFVRVEMRELPQLIAELAAINAKVKP
jgi:hypothetical protein